MKITIFLFIVFLIVIPFINADALAIGSGGDNHIVISSNKYMGNLFWNLEEEETPATTTSTTATSSAGGSGGGGAGTTTSKPAIEGGLVVSDKFIEVPIVINTVKTRSIEVYNKGAKDINVSLKIEGLEDFIILNKKDLSFKLSPNERRTIDLKIVGPDKPGIYTGKILVNDYEILMSISASTKEILFDVEIVVPDEFKIINAGDKLNSQITLIPMGEKSRLDSTLNYVIKDFNGKVYLTESETLLIDGQKTFKKTFATQNLPPGNYILGLELVYINGVATSTSHFEVKSMEKKFPDYGLILYFLIGSILLLVIGIILLIKKYKKIRGFKINRKRG